MFSRVSVCPQSALWLLAHCSTLRHGQYASYWNAFCILFSLRRNSMTFCLTIPVFLLLPRSLVHKFNVFIIQIKLTNEARNSVTFTIILDGAWRESLKIVFRSWGSNGKRKSIQKLKDKHNRVFPKVDHSGRSARIVLEQINSAKKTTSNRSWTLDPNVLLTSCLSCLTPVLDPIAWKIEALIILM